MEHLRRWRHGSECGQNAWAAALPASRSGLRRGPCWPARPAARREKQESTLMTAWPAGYVQNCAHNVMHAVAGDGAEVVSAGAPPSPVCRPRCCLHCPHGSVLSAQRMHCPALRGQKPGDPGGSR